MMNLWFLYLLQIKLVILDSVAFHFRHDFEDLSLRTRLLTHLAQTLVAMARKYNIAVSGFFG